MPKGREPHDTWSLLAKMQPYAAHTYQLSQNHTAMHTATHLPFWVHVLEQCKQQGRLSPHTTFVCPTEASIDYVQSHRAEGSDPRFGPPTFRTLRRLMLDASPLATVPPERLLGKLHATAQKCHALEPGTSFERFYPCGKALLQDFDLAEQYLVPPEKLFEALFEDKKLHAAVAGEPSGGGHPRPEEAARSQGLFPENEALLFWEQLPELYRLFADSLIEEGIGYAGLCLRFAATEMNPQPFAECRELVFVGFNQLTPSEVRFAEACKERVSTSFFWDADAHYMDHDLHPAGHYLRTYRSHPCFQQGFPTAVPNHLRDERKRLFVSEMATSLAQVQQVLDALQTPPHATEAPLAQTAVVVSGTDLLVPLLEKLDPLGIPLRARLHYPLKHTLLHAIATKAISLWEGVRAPIPNGEHNRAEWQALLCLIDPWVEMDLPIQPIATDPVHRPACLEREQVAHTSSPWEAWEGDVRRGIADYLKEILSWLDLHFTQKRTLLLDLNRSALRYVLALLEAWTSQPNPTEATPAWVRTLLQESLFPFHAESHEPALHLLEVSESHNLDFERIFVLNMSERSFPTLPAVPSLLPYALRHRFGLPIPEMEAERAASYGWYRLLQRAQIACCSYGDLGSGLMEEKSRLLWQLEYEGPLRPIQQPKSFPGPMHQPLVLSVPKDAQVLQLLDPFLVGTQGSNASLSPSALVCYLSCPLQFYFSYLLRIKPTTYSQEQTTSLELGTFLHRVLERLYQPWVGKKWLPGTAKTLRQQLPKTIQEVLTEARERQKSALQTPQLLAALLEKWVDKQVEEDEKYAPFTLIAVEMGSKTPWNVPLRLPHGPTLRLGGVVDRVDAKEGNVRIVDYKLGTPNTKAASLEALWDPACVHENSAMLQVVFYAWLFQSTQKRSEPYRLVPCLASPRGHFVGNYTSGIWIQDQTNTKRYAQIEDLTPHLKAFEQKLTELLSQLMDPTLPFAQTDNAETCCRCPYVGICQKERIR